MFLYQLNLKEKMAFVQLAKEMVTVDDGKIDIKEHELVSIMANEMQVPIESFLSMEFNLEQLAGEFKSLQSKKICIAELLSLALINEEFHEKQKLLIDSLVNIFNISSDEYSKIEVWVKEALECSRIGAMLILGEEG